VLGDHDWGVRMELKRNPNYWKGDSRAHFDEALLLGIADASARQNALVSGEIDAMNRVDLKTSHLLGRDPNVIIDDITGNQHYTIPMNSTVAPFDNKDVRLALKYAIDREDLVKKILNGHGAPANDHPIGPGQKYFNRDLEQRKYDPDKAKFHLKKAGMENLKVDLHAANTAFAGAIDTAVLYQAAAKAAGIDINVIREADDGYWVNVWMKKPWSMSYWGGRPTEDWMFTVGYAAGGAWNESFWSNDRFMELLVAARAELDRAKRAEMYGEMQQLVRDDGGSVIPMYANNVDARSKKVAHMGKLASNWELDGWKCLDRWWFA
jgi:peptide/nickel transport system substrate-binding protein